MAKPVTTSLFKTPGTRAEPPMDKTSRAVRGILDDEAEKRAVMRSRLRKARLERDAAMPVVDSE